MTLVDSHCHLDDAKFDDDREQVIERALAAGVDAHAGDRHGDGPPDLEVAIRLAERYPFIYATIGVHPHDASKATEETFARLRDLAAHPKVLAIGEIGLDYHYDFSPRDVQRAVFDRQLEIAAEAGKPIVIHTREAWDDTLAQARRALPRRRHHALLHGRRGAGARRRSICGFHLSFGGVLTFPKAEGAARGGAHRARRPPAGRDRLSVSRARAASRQTQRAGLRGGDGAPPGRGARHHAGGDRGAHHAQLRAPVFAAQPNS